MINTSEENLAGKMRIFLSLTIFLRESYILKKMELNKISDKIK